MPTRVLSISSQKRAAQIFNFLSVIAILLMPIFPLLLIWIAASIVVYSANIYHPNQLVRRYTKHAGYRFYGFTGMALASMSFSGILVRVAGDAVTLMLFIWLIGFLIVVPMGLWSLFKAGREDWNAMLIEEA
jgi:hypothetical protein